MSDTLSAGDDVIRLRLDEVESDFDVRLDWTKFTLRDAIEFDRASEGISAAEQQELILGVIEKLSGQNPLDMPMLVARTLIMQVAERLSGRGRTAKNS